MAVSAFRGGKLKKRALLGTSLAADPTRGKEREAFKSLYSEARGYASDPEAFKSMIGKRHAAATEKGLGQIAEVKGQMGSIQEEMTALQGQRATTQSWLDLYNKQAEGAGKMAGTTAKKAWKIGKTSEEALQGTTEHWQSLSNEERLAAMPEGLQGDYLAPYLADIEGFLTKKGQMKNLLQKRGFKKKTEDLREKQWRAKMMAQGKTKKEIKRARKGEGDKKPFRKDYAKEYRKYNRANVISKAYEAHLQQQFAEKKPYETLTEFDRQLQEQQLQLESLAPLQEKLYRPLAEKASLYGNFFTGV